MRVDLQRLAPGVQLDPIQKTPKLRNMIAFSRYAHDYDTGESVHCFPEVAKRKGFPRAIAQGLMSHAYISQLIAERFGEQVFARSRVNVKFLKPTPEGDTLTVGGTVKRVEPDAGGKRVFLDVWCKNPDGVVMTVGEAEVTVLSPGESHKKSR